MTSDFSQSSPVVYADGEDPEMNRAMERARQTFRFFWREMAWERRRIIPGLDVACVKFAFADPPGEPTGGKPSVEQMWVNEIDFDGLQVSGTLINEPNWLVSVKEGDHVEMPLGRVNDWMYAIEGRVYGAYTVNLLRSRMGRSERAQHDSAWGLDFGDPNQIQLIPESWLGKKPAGLLGRWFGSGASEPQDPEELAAREHPMALNMTPSLEEHLKQDSSSVSAADDKGLTLLHQLAMAGAAQGVALLLRYGADPNAKTKRGLTAAQLAQTLGWENVLAVLRSN
jgi:uncharacterized protein YegJ (DUF2314 family)